MNNRGITGTHLTILSEIALIMFEKQYSCRPSSSAVIDTVPVDCFICLARALASGSVSLKNVIVNDRCRTQMSGPCSPRNQCQDVLPLLLDTSQSSGVKYDHISTHSSDVATAPRIPCHSYASLRRNIPSFLLPRRSYARIQETARGPR